MRRIARIVVRKCAWLVVSVWGACSLVFVLSRLTGDPVVLMSPPNATAEELAATTERFGLDQPLLVQYVDFLRGAVRGDFGESYRYGEPALDVVVDRLPATLMLATAALLLSVGIGVPLGLRAAFRPSGVTDRVGRFLAVFGQSVPTFLLAPLLIMLFGVRLGWLPTSGNETLSALVLPAVSLAALQVAVLFRLTRSLALDALGSDYILLARSKGARTRRVAFEHVGPNILPPLLTLIGITIASFITGSIIVENVFAWPGIGRLLATAASVRDFPVIQAVVLISSFAFIGFSTLMEVLQEVLDPRVPAS